MFGLHPHVVLLEPWLFGNGLEGFLEGDGGFVGRVVDVAPCGQGVDGYFGGRHCIGRWKMLMGFEKEYYCRSLVFVVA